MTLVVVQCKNHIGQCKQGLVDLGTLLEADSFIAGSPIIFVACFPKKSRMKLQLTINKKNDILKDIILLWGFKIWSLEFVYFLFTFIIS